MMISVNPAIPGLGGPILTAGGVFDDLPEAEYFSVNLLPEWSLSASGITKLLPEPFGGCPAKFQWDRLNPEDPKKHYDFGHAAHRLVLGKGAEIASIDFPAWTTKEARAAREAAREAGKTPLLKVEADRAKLMADTLFAHPFAGNAFRNGKAEQSLIWRDEEFGIWCRSRLDYSPNVGTIYANYKTAIAADNESLARAIWNYGYFAAAAFYIEGIKATGLCENPTYLFVFQEKEPPHLVVCVQPTATQIEWGNIINRHAKSVFARCLRTGVWPGYTDDVIALDLPRFGEIRLQNAHDAGLFETSREFQRPLDEAE